MLRTKIIHICVIEYFLNHPPGNLRGESVKTYLHNLLNPQNKDFLGFDYKMLNRILITKHLAVPQT